MLQQYGVDTVNFGTQGCLAALKFANELLKVVSQGCFNLAVHSLQGSIHLQQVGCLVAKK